MRKTLLLSSGILLVVLGLTLLAVASGYVNSTPLRTVKGATTAFETTGYFYSGETMRLTMTTPHDWAHYITDSVTVFLNFSFTSDGGSIRFRATYDAYTSDISGTTLSNPALDLINVSMFSSSGNPPVSEASVSKLANEGLLGGAVLRDGNVTVALDSQTASNSFGSSTAPKIALRADKTLFPYAYLSPFGVVSIVLAVPLLVLSWRKREERRSR